MVDGKLRDDTDAGCQLATELTEGVNTPERELVSERRGHCAAVIHGQHAPVEVDIYRLQAGQESAHEAVAVGVQLDRARKVECEARGRCLGVAEPAGNAQDPRSDSRIDRAPA